jgi:hypothetical protein
VPIGQGRPGHAGMGDLGASCVIAGALIDEFAKEHRHDHLRWVRNALAGQMVGASRRELPGQAYRSATLAGR